MVEADEYDTAFFDKRSKFVHYRPLVAILNNLEYDHADIFPDVAAIQRQFHHLVRTVPRRGRLIVNGEDEHLAEVLAMGCWTPVETFGWMRACCRSAHEATAIAPTSARARAFDWTARLLDEDGSAFVVVHDGREIGEVRWPLLGRHNVMNALAALAAAHAVGVDVAAVLPALAAFRSVKRRMEVIGEARRHHRLRRLRPPPDRDRDHARRPAREGRRRAHRGGDGAAQQFDAPGRACRCAGAVAGRRRRGGVPASPGTGLGCRQGGRRPARRRRGRARRRCADRARCANACARGDHVVFMSNGGFDGAPRRFLAALQTADR